MLASVFPQAAACFENIEGDIQIPDHPLVREVMRTCCRRRWILKACLAVLRGIQDGSIRCLAVDTPVPSQFAHELLNANPYAFLDEAGLEERRARAVSLNGGIPASVLEQPGKLDPRAIETVRGECWPDIRDHHELHDLLMSLVVLAVSHDGAGSRSALDRVLMNALSAMDGRRRFEREGHAMLDRDGTARAGAGIVV